MGIGQTTVWVVVLPVLVLTRAAGAPLPPKGGLIRGMYADPGSAVDNRVWGGYGKGYELDRQERHTGETSIRCSNATDAEAHGASQFVTFNQATARPLVISGWAKLEGVGGPADYRCSVYLDLRLKTGESWAMQIAVFDPQKTGWQYAEAIHQPPAPIANASVYAFLREKAGTAWFDDIYVGQLLDDGKTRSDNLLQSPGFEDSDRISTERREAFFKPLSEIGCNAFHLYRGVAWETVMKSAELPPIEEDDPFLDFVREAHKRGFKVWVTVGVGLPSISGPDSPDFPIYGCVNERWGEAYTKAVAYMAQYGVDAVGVVPDEWNYNTSPVEELKKSQNPQVADLYAKLPLWCNCPTCQERFTKQYGVPYPDVTQAWETADPVWAQFTQFRYDSTRDWIDRTVKAAKMVNPQVITDTMICVLPVCSDDRLSTGAAWDEIGATTGLDCLQTDPYIFLHNYLGDSTHLYPTETTLHLGAANYPRRCGVTLEACRLYDTYRDKDPVDVYGAALSCWVHGASEFFWWHMNYILGRETFVDPKQPKAAVRSVYDLMQAMEPYLAGGEVPGEVLVCYSRRSEDLWDWLSRAGAEDRLRTRTAGPKRGFLAHRNVLYALLRQGYPFRMTFLEHPDPGRLAQAKVLVVPFPYALSESEVVLLRAQAEGGKTVVLMSALSPVDELGQELERPRLVTLSGATPLSTDQPTSRKLGKGTVVFLPGDFAINLFEPVAPERDPKKRVPLPAFRPGGFEQLAAIIAQALGRPGSLLAEPPAQDIETTLLVSPTAYVVLAINWDTEKPATCTLQLPIPVRKGKLDGRRVQPGGKVEPVQTALEAGRLSLTLQRQEACLLALRK